MKKLLLFFLFLIVSISIFAQATIKGIVQSSDGEQALSGVIISIEGTKITTQSRADGRFKLGKVPDRRVVLVFTSKEYRVFTKEIDVNQKVIDLGTIALSKPEQNASGSVTETIQTISLDDTDASETTEEQNIASQLGASRDLFRQATSFNWSSARYRQRGYLNNYTEQYFNGVPFNELDDERVAFNAYGGLNDVTRLQQNYIGLEPNSFAFGDLAGSFNVDTRASMQRKQTRVSYMNANRNYSHRLMATYSTGLMPNGWAVSISGSHRWAQEGYVPGTFMDAYAYFISVDKKLNKKHLFNLTAFGAPSKQGRSGPVIQEMYDLAGTCFYNPYWGYQEGKKRNARVQTTHSPTAILRHDYTPSQKFTLTTAASFQYERFGQTDLDWYNAPDPRPDYYSKLPSATDDEEQKRALTTLFQNDENVRQLNWASFYNINRSSRDSIVGATIDGVKGQTIAGNRSRYVLYERRNDSREMNFYTNAQYQITENQQFVGGLSYRYFRGEDFKKLKDLLGGDFFMDVDQFSERDFPGLNVGQNDLLNPNRVIKPGDRYGYNYYTHVRNAFAWGQWMLNTRKVDFFVAGKVSNSGFWREGLTQNGRFPENSLGESDKANFFSYGTKAGATYKINGRNYLHVYGGYMTKAPNSRDAFLSPRTRNELANGLTNEKIASVESGYNYRSPYFSAQVTGYYTTFEDKVKASSFFSDEDRAFVNYVARGLNMRHMGVEAALEWKVIPQLEIYAAGTIGEHIYTSRPVATATPDNGSTSIQSNLNDKTIYLKNFYIPNSPQTAAVLGFRYNAKRFWFLNVSCNYFANRWMDINFNRRTEYAVSYDANGADKIIKDSPLWNEILDQQKLPDAITLNLLAGKSFLFRGYRIFKDEDKKGKFYKGLREKSYRLNLTFGVDNLLDYKYTTFAFEQWRFDWETKNINRFPPKYSYAFGRNYFAMATLSF